MKFVSILGDSISTFTGYNPEGYDVYYYRYNQILNGMQDVYDTWWAKVIRALHAYLCVNNSFSGSRVTGNKFPAASSEERTSAMHTDQYRPDLILVYIGFNDFGYGMQIKRSDSRILQKSPWIFADAYEVMLSALKKNYPEAQIICGTLLLPYLKDDKDWRFSDSNWHGSFEDYNEAIRECCRSQDLTLADLSAQKILYVTIDGLHPTVNGHQTIASAWIKCLTASGLI